jgi:hypothetical protein
MQKGNLFMQGPIEYQQGAIIMKSVVRKFFVISFLTAMAAFAAAAQSSQQQTQVSASASSSASASASAGPASANASSETNVNAQLTSAVDARKCHPGDEIIAKTTQDVKEGGHVVFHKGTRLVGHVTEAQARTKENAESSLGIAFDEAVMRDGTRIAFHASIQALAETQAAANAGFDDGDAMMGGASGMAGGGMARGGLVGGTGSVVGGTAGGVGATAGGLGRTAGGTLGAASSVAGSATGHVGGLNAAGELTSNSRGVFGMQGLSLASSAGSRANASLITSSSRNVHLSSGTQMLLTVAAH